MERSPAPLARLASLLVLVAAFSSCAQRAWMMVPPHFDLAGCGRIGLVELECNERDLARRATQELQERLLEANPGLQVHQLVGYGDGLDPDALLQIREAYGLDAVFVGSVQISEIRPTFDIRSSLVEVEARAEVQGTMSVRLIETAGGATVWTRSADDRVTVAAGSLNTEGQGSFGMTDPQATRTAMVQRLASHLTQDFRAQYFRKKVEDIPPHYRPTYPDGVEVYAPPEVAGVVP